MGWLNPFAGKKRETKEDTITTTSRIQQNIDILSEHGKSNLADLAVIQKRFNLFYEDCTTIIQKRFNLLYDKLNASNCTELVAILNPITPEVQGLLLDKVRDDKNVQIAILGAGFSASFVLGFRVGRIRPRWQRLTSVQDIPSTFFGPTAPMLRGKVVTVTDGDTLRFLHVPTIFHSTRIPKGDKMSLVALPIRLNTIDAPETAKFGKPGQAFGIEAKETLHSLTLNKTIRIRLLRKDQFGRAVAEVRTGIWPFYRYMDEQMLRYGMAEVYQGGGAVYGSRGKKAYLGMEETARSNKLGMWSLEERESAADFKARMKAEG